MVARLVTKVAVVTGSASGIGLATARLAASRGYTVMGLDVAPERADEEVATASGGTIRDVDVADPTAVRVAVTEAAGLGDVLLAVSAAGILREVPLVELEDRLFAETLRVHLGGLFNLTQACAKTMGPGGVVIAVSSELATLGAPEHAHYVTAKSAINGFVRCAARELADAGIRVHAIAPGPVDTPLLGPSGRDATYVASLPLRRLGQPHEIAQAILDLCSWTWATGSIVAVNGGAVIRG
jgi:NAD(P)-dependent dehydrogenase (short-subunit alcohol dehydrogenase family)